ncbi:hypothetical protein MKX01_037265 [Papaver californicum]|nr:hypothetical protein MKX01_037265 [Papaver californicum]
MSPACDGIETSSTTTSCSCNEEDIVKPDDQNCLHCKIIDQTSSSCFSDFIRSDKDFEKLRRILISSAKGFSIGAGLKGGLSIFSILARFKKTKLSPTQRNAGMVSNGEAIIKAVQETLRYGLFLGAFAGTFASVDEFIAAVGGHRRTAGWRALLAGAIAGPTMLMTGPNTQHTSLAIYILMRAAVLASRCGIKSKRFGGICQPLTWAHGDIFLMCLSSSQILSAYILKQNSLPHSYKSFLNTHGGKHAALSSKASKRSRIVHGNQSCQSHILSFLCQAYARALPVYLPVYLFPALIVHRQDLLKRPFTILGKGLFGTARSSMFLSVYCSSAWMWTCILFRIFKTCNIPMVAMGTFPPGLALAIEKKSRRIEISLYCFSRAIESFFTCMIDAGIFPKSKKLNRADVVIFSLSTAIIMHCYAQEREVFRSKYLNVLDWVFGVPPPTCETPRTKQN